MGIFDQYIDPDQYQPGGGLLGRLLATVQAGGYDPQAVASDPMDANAAMPPAAPAAAPPVVNAPIAVGNYQMPRIGPGFPAGDGSPALAPQPQQVPPGPTASTAPAQQQPPATSGGLNHLSAAFSSMANGGGLLGGVHGLISGQREDPQAQAIRERYSALAPILGPQKAMIAVISPPEVSNKLIDQAFTQGTHRQERDPDGNIWDVNLLTGQRTLALAAKDDKVKFVQLKDNMGADRPAFVNTTNQTVNDMPIAQWNKQNNPEGGGALGNPNLTGKDYLASIPPAQRGTVQGMIEGTVPPPSSFALSKPYWTNMIAAAKTADPTFDAANWAGRVAGVRDFSSGKSSEMVRSANQVLGHLSTLTEKMDALKNGNYPALNAVENYATSAAGGPAQVGFSLAANAVSDELGKIYKGGGLSDHEIQAWKSNLSPNMSPSQQRESVSTAAELLNHALTALEEKRLNSIGPMAAEKAGPLLKPDAQASLAKIHNWTTGSSSDDSAAGAPQPSTPNRTKTGVTWSVQ